MHPFHRQEKGWPGLRRSRCISHRAGKVWGTRTSPGALRNPGPGVQQPPGACLGQCGSQPLAALSAWSALGFLPHPHPQLHGWGAHSLNANRWRTCSPLQQDAELGRGCLGAEAPAQAPRHRRAHTPRSRLPKWRAPGCAGDWAGRGGARAGDPPPSSLPLPRRLTDLGHLPQPMSASQGGPWNPGLRLLRVVASAVGNQNQSGLCRRIGRPSPADPQAEGLGAGRPQHRSARGRAEPPQPHAPPRTHSPPLPPQHPWGPGDFEGVWGFGSREITGTERRLSFPWRRFLFDCLDPVPGRRERDGGAESGLPTQPTRTPTRVPRTGSPLPPLTSLFGYFRQSSLALAQPDRLCRGEGERSQGRSAPCGQMCPSTGVGA